MFSSAGRRISYQSGFKSGSDATVRKSFQRFAMGNTLFAGTADGGFIDLPSAAGAQRGRWAWGSRFADINNDGWEDILVANGFITTSNSGDL
jgi:hypothetical protein